VCYTWVLLRWCCGEMMSPYTDVLYQVSATFGIHEGRLLHRLVVCSSYLHSLDGVTTCQTSHSAACHKQSGRWRWNGAASWPVINKQTAQGRTAGSGGRDTQNNTTLGPSCRSDISVWISYLINASEASRAVSAGRHTGRDKMVTSPAGDICRQPITDRSQVQPRPLTWFG